MYSITLGKEKGMANQEMLFLSCLIIFIEEHGEIKDRYTEIEFKELLITHGVVKNKNSYSTVRDNLKHKWLFPRVGNKSYLNPHEDILKLLNKDITEFHLNIKINEEIIY